MNEAATFPADYFDGVSSGRRAVEVTREGQRVRIVGDGVSLEVAVAEVRVQPRVGRTPLRLLLPGNGLLVAPAERVAPVLEIPAARGLAHRLESHLGVVVASLAGVAVSAWVGVHFGIPWAAERIAERIPPQMERDIAEEGLRQFDALVLRPSALPDERKERLAGIFAQLRTAAGGPAAQARLEFRRGRWVGPNAFALPGGVVVLTDELVEIMRNDDEVAAVLAHELGHLNHRHGSRQILQGSMVGLLGVAIAGDASTLASAVVGLPTMLIHTGYSRDFEREADRYAYGLMRATHRSPRLLADALSRLQAWGERMRSQGNRDDTAAPKRPRSRELGYLSTHPATAERIRDAEEAAR